MRIKEFKLEVICNNPYQKRQAYKNIEGFARTIATDDLQQIPKGRWNADGVQLKFGHRRREAFLWLKANWKTQKLPDRYNGYSVMPIEIEDLTDEQMFRGATIENSQREELSAIERMEEMKGWVEFGYNSEQIAALYPGTAAATVRGLLAFDKLPSEAKEALHKGGITQGTARALLSLKRISSDKVIVETLKKIEKSGGRELPEVIMENVADRLGNVVEMWVDGHEDGKPRASRRAELWYLDMQNFPNQLLPELSKAAIVDAFGKDDKRIADEINRAFSGFQVGVDEALDFFKANIHVPADLREKLIQMGVHLQNPPVCSACPYYTKVRGSHYCGLKVCHDRKSAAWAQEKLNAAAKSLKIEIYNSGRDGKYKVLDGYGRDETLFTKRHKDLRLIAKDKVKGHAYQHLKGVDDDFFLVVGTKAALDKSTPTKKADEQITDKERQKELIRKRQIKLLRSKQKEFTWEFTLIGRTLFESLNLEVLEQLDSWKYLGVDDRPAEELRPTDNAGADIQTNYLRRLMVLNLLSRDFSHFTRIMQPNLVSTARKFESYARKWGVKMPKSIMKMAVQGDLEIKAVSTATKVKR